ncbi:high mobility group box domain-containing protein [Gilbertella persicaria]|uniref:high mobility group box domain-containing protein n=1 Tax=Gilbertella persicaria TaxID=101096 RepID=UPI0022206192|nr:high mobility group box domain-containing protein [Gilbertella persicaria]KAI8092451.1 high mobility group box domain-containing protein [Gilbertella persicaria]
MSRNDLNNVINKISENLNSLADILLTEKNQKKRKDPHAPKPPPTSFILFSNSIREKIEQEKPNATFVEKSKIYGAEWQKLTEKERQPFVEEAKKEREEYKKKLAEYEDEKIQPPEKRARLEIASSSSSSSSSSASSDSSSSDSSDSFSSDESD